MDNRNLNEAYEVIKEVREEYLEKYAVAINDQYGDSIVPIRAALTALYKVEQRIKGYTQ